MSSNPESAETSEPASQSKKQISTQRRVISWVFIAILLGVVLLEWRAKSSQANTFESLGIAMDKADSAGNGGEFPFSEFEKSIQGNPSVEIDDSGAIMRLYHYKWNGIFKTYHLRLLVNDEDLVVTYDAESEGDAVNGKVRISKKNMQELVQRKKQEAAAQKAAAEASAAAEPAKIESTEKEPAAPDDK
ncbi:hypothetical protein [Gimesia sp.]|uniref:hypothetical protein n=1 Tax=Gimesia sp. TaxID=2024833 RepID=UPI003A8EBDED